MIEAFLLFHALVMLAVVILGVRHLIGDLDRIFVCEITERDVFRPELADDISPARSTKRAAP